MEIDEWTHRDILKKEYKKRLNKARYYISKKEVRNYIFERDGYKCLKCGSKENLQIDHIISVYKNGKNELENLQTLCKKCNCSKNPVDDLDYTNKR